MQSFKERRDQFCSSIFWEQTVSPIVIEPRKIIEKGSFSRLKNSGCVLTGANSAGKTTLIRAFDAKGIPTVEEFLRSGYEVGEKLFGDYAVARMCSDVVVETSLAAHLRAISLFSDDRQDPIIFDRGLGDFIGYLQLVNILTSPAVHKSFLKNLVTDPDIRKVLNEDMDFEEIRSSCQRQIRHATEWAQEARYKVVFWLDALPTFENDGLRSTDRMTNNALAYFTRKAWKDMGYQLVRVPPFFGDIEGRVQFITQSMEQKNGPHDNRSRCTSYTSS